PTDRGRVSGGPPRFRYVRRARTARRLATNQRRAPTSDEREASAVVASRPGADLDTAGGSPHCRPAPTLQARRTGRRPVSASTVVAVDQPPPAIAHPGAARLQRGRRLPSLARGDRRP